ncbi:MAG: Sec-dependent nitrous-oxide reductase [Bacteroidia bacterium]|nr:Sec-dependent nitrous-oxide reductase [Bacteroidia bacterium]
MLSKLFFGTVLTSALISCSQPENTNVLGEDVASKVYVPPGKYDEFYAFMSGGFSGQVAVYGLPSGRLFRVIPVFSQDPQDGYGYSEDSKAMLSTSFGSVPWGDAHHPQLSRTDGTPDGRWLFINENNTPRIARINLNTFTTSEIIEIPNSAGNHSSPFCTENTEYVVAGTRFAVPVEDGKKDVPIDSYKGNFKGMLSWIKVDKNTGRMNIAFQLEMPGFDWDLSRSGKGPSADWSFFTCYNSEEAHTLLEVNASQNDKDFILAVNWKKLEELANSGKGELRKTTYYDNVLDEGTHIASSNVINEVRVLQPADCEGAIYLIPCPKSPHGCDVDPTGQYFVGNGKLAAQITEYSYDKMQDAIKNKSYEGDRYGIPVLKYDAVVSGVVEKPGLGPLHTEFDDKGFAYTSMFISSEIVKWNVKSCKVVDRIPVYYSIGHLLVPGGDGKHPWGKYVVALDKITKDRYLPTGPELCQSAQLIDISGDKMKMLLDFPTIGEPHYAQAIPADILMKNNVKIYKLEDNKNPYAVKSPDSARMVRSGSRVDIYLATIRSHFTPDNMEGLREGDDVYFHVTNLEQDWDEPHGFAVIGNNNSELLIMPGETKTLYWKAPSAGIYPFYCTDFCSALHQEMQGYLRVSPASSSAPLKWGLNDQWKQD